MSGRWRLAERPARALERAVHGGDAVSSNSATSVAANAALQRISTGAGAAGAGARDKGQPDRVPPTAASAGSGSAAPTSPAGTFRFSNTGCRRAEVHRPHAPPRRRACRDRRSSHLVQPRAERRALEARLAPPGAQHRLLHGVLGLERRGHSVAIAGQLAAMLLECALGRRARERTLPRRSSYG